MPPWGVLQVLQVGKLKRVWTEYKAVVELRLDKDFQRDLGNLEEMRRILEEVKAAGG